MLRLSLYFCLVRLLFLIMLFWSLTASAQAQIDSLQLDSVRMENRVMRDTVVIHLQHAFASDSFLYRDRLFFSFQNPVRYTISERMWMGKEGVFYTVIGLLLFFAFIKNTFRRYVSDLLGTYFRTTVYQRQNREQLLQNPLPSLLFNIFFVLSSGVFAGLVLVRETGASDIPFWRWSAYAAAGIAGMYLGKFLFLKFLGWVTQAEETIGIYLFVVFSTNKVIGMMLLPFIVLLAFTYGGVATTAVTISLVVLVGLFLYRYFLSFISINRTIRINFFHFFIYLVALEILPLLLINKLLFTVLPEIS